MPQTDNLYLPRLGFFRRHFTVKINVKKLDATIEKLQQLRRLATDPALSDFIEITGKKSNSNGNGTQSGLDEDSQSELMANVLAACVNLTGTFTIKEVYARMAEMGTQGTGTEKSVSNMLRSLAGEELIEVAVRGQGRRATSYRNK